MTTMETVTEIRREVRSARAVKPHWLTIPAAVHYSSVSRSKIYEKIESGEIRSVCLREPDSMRGTRLINKASLDAYLSKHENLKSEPVPGRKGRKSKKEKEAEAV
jgi:excisionase family DNA binding protein